MGIGDKVKEVAHKMGVGHTGDTKHASDLGSSYQNVGATYGSEGAPGIAGPVAPGSGAVASTTGAAPMSEGTYGTGMYDAETHGGREYYTGATTGTTDTRTGIAEMPVAVQQTTTTTEPGYERQGEAAVCGQQYYTKTEDRPIVKERVEYVQEHRPVEKEFVVETKATGAERAVGGGEVEHLGTTERVVSEAGAKGTC